MDYLSKQQLILVALLVSFVTSLATGIITVSLMDQAPANVIRTISQVVERTIEKAAPQNAAVGSSSDDDPVVVASHVVSASVVKIKSRTSKEIAGLGLIVSNKGVIITDKSNIATLTDYEAVFSEGARVPIAVVQSQIDGNVVFLAPVPPIPADLKRFFVPVSFASRVTLGQTIFSLSGTSTMVLGYGFVTEAPPTLSGLEALPIRTSIRVSEVVPGSPLFNVKGEVIGVQMGSLSSENGAAFYPLGAIRGVIPVL